MTKHKLRRCDIPRSVFVAYIYTERYLLTSRIRTVSSLVADNQAGRQSKVGL